jgi:hypothetical protein
MNLSLVELYPLFPVGWLSLLVALGVWTRRESLRATPASLWLLLGVASLLVLIRALFGEAPTPEGSASTAQWSYMVAISLLLVMPAGLLGARIFNWARNRGAGWGAAFGACAVVAIPTSILVVAGAVMVILVSSSLLRP